MGEESKTKKRLVLTGGGTAGHVYPCLALYERLKDYQVHYIGGGGMERGIVAKEKGIVYHEISAVKFERKLTMKNLLVPFRLVKAIKDADRILKEIKPAALFSKGGFVALPVCIAARRLKIPVVSHESDLSMGLANKIIYRFCNVMCTTFEATCKDEQKYVFTGQPIRKEVLNGNKNNLVFYPYLNKTKKNLLIVGGSSGAKFINEKVAKCLDKLLENFNVIHITGRGKISKNNRCGYVQIEYAENMGDLLDMADVVVSRAGSGAIHEFLATLKPMLLIPLSKSCSRGDQIENAKLFKALGYCEMIEEEDFSEEIFFEKLDNLVKNDKKYIKNMKKSGKNDACDKIIELIKKIER